MAQENQEKDDVDEATSEMDEKSIGKVSAASSEKINMVGQYNNRFG